MVIGTAMSAYLFTAFYLCTAIILLGNVYAECPYGWHHYDISCYFFSTDNYSWLNAQNSCRGHDARLAEVDNKAQSDYLMLMARTLGKDHNYWLGGRDDVVEGTWMWSSTDEFFTYTDWYPEQPNNYLGNQDCLHMHASFNMKWQDESCTHLGRYICEKISCEDGSQSTVSTSASQDPLATSLYWKDDKDFDDGMKDPRTFSFKPEKAPGLQFGFLTRQSLKAFKKPVDFLYLFLTHQIVLQICIATNHHAEQLIAKGQNLSYSDSDGGWNQVTVAEMYRYPESTASSPPIIG